MVKFWHVNWNLLVISGLCKVRQCRGLEASTRWLRFFLCLAHFELSSGLFSRLDLRAQRPEVREVLNGSLVCWHTSIVGVLALKRMRQEDHEFELESHNNFEDSLIYLIRSWRRGSIDNLVLPQNFYYIYFYLFACASVWKRETERRDRGDHNLMCCSSGIIHFLFCFWTGSFTD